MVVQLDNLVNDRRVRRFTLKAPRLDQQPALNAPFAGSGARWIVVWIGKVRSIGEVAGVVAILVPCAYDASGKREIVG